MNKLKKWLGFLLCMAFLCGIISASSIPAYAKDPRLVDEAGLLSADEARAVEQKLDEVSQAHQMDLVIVTVNSLGGQYIVNYADDYFDYHDYGYGSDRDGLLLLIDMGGREWAMSTSGKAISTFTDAGQEYIQDRFVSYLSSGQYEDAFLTFARICDSFMTQAENGNPYDSNNMPAQKLSIVNYLEALLAGIVMAWMSVRGLKGNLKTVHQKSGAHDYIRDGSIALNQQQDLFLYDRVTRVPKPKPQNRGGGSSTHMGSSGRSHGGSHGSF